jgi:hypothetical protein
MSFEMFKKRWVDSELWHVRSINREEAKEPAAVALVC